MAFISSFAFCVQILGFITHSIAHPTVSLQRRADACPWPDGGVIYNCYRVNEDHEYYFGVQIDVFRFPQVEDIAYPLFLHEALEEVMPTYSAFLASLPPTRVTVYIVEQTTRDHTDGLTTRAPSNRAHCYIMIRAGSAVAGDASSEARFKATIAHEFYHCVQKRFNKSYANHQQELASVWWKEGTPEFFASYFYPSTFYGDSIFQYRVTESPYETNARAHGEAGALIFMYLLNSGWTLEKIHGWMTKQTFVETREAEISRIVADGTLGPVFPDFATQYFDHKIAFRDGTRVEPLHDIPAITFTVPDSDLWDWLMDVDPFTAQRHETTFTADKAVSVVFTPSEPGDKSLVVQYRKGNGNGWKILSPGDKVDLQNTPDSQCPSGSQLWTFIVTSTADATAQRDGVSHGTLSFSVHKAQKKRDDECDEPLDKCLVGDWNMDISAMQTYLSEKLKSLQGVTVSNLLISGSATLGITDAFFSAMKLESLRIGYDAVSEDGIAMHSTLVIDGSATGTLTLGTGNSAFTWSQDFETSGAIHTVTNIPSLGLDLPLDFPMDKQYSSSVNVQYFCDGNKMQMVGYLDGGYIWAYTWVKV